MPNSLGSVVCGQNANPVHPLHKSSRSTNPNLQASDSVESFQEI
jgi:hypothetical protein